MYYWIFAKENFKHSIHQIPIRAGEPIPCHLCGRFHKWERQSKSFVCVHKEDHIAFLNQVPISPFSSVPFEKVLVEFPISMFEFVFYEEPFRKLELKIQEMKRLRKWLNKK